MNIYKIILDKGLFEETGTNEFSSRSCPVCGALTGKRIELKGFIDLQSARSNDYYEFEACEQCVYEAHYGEE